MKKNKNRGENWWDLVILNGVSHNCRTVHAVLVSSLSEKSFKKQIHIWAASKHKRNIDRLNWF